jgi:CBS domain-containing protein
MTDRNQCQILGTPTVELSDDDVLTAMKSIQGYIDITPADFKEIYQLAFRHAFDRLGQSVKAQDIMTTSVISVNADTDLIETAQRMADNAISGLPVIDGKGIVIGVISEKDFFQDMGANENSSFMQIVAECLSNKGCLAVSIREKLAKDIMTSPAITAELNTSISTLSNILTGSHINRVPIVSSEGKLHGIVTRGDLVDSFCAKVL